MSELRSARGTAQIILSIGSIKRLEDEGLSVVFTARLREIEIAMNEMLAENKALHEKLQQIRSVLDA